MGSAKQRKDAGTYPEPTFEVKDRRRVTEEGAPKKTLGELSKEDLISSLLVSLAKRGYVSLLVLIPDQAVHPKEFQRSNFSIYGGVQDTNLQVQIFREVADRIEDSMDAGEIQKQKQTITRVS